MLRRFTERCKPRDRLNRHQLPPSAPRGYLLLRTLAAPVNPADVNTLQGTYGQLPRLVPSPFGLHVPPLDFPSAVPGNEGAFAVVAAGSDVLPDDFAPGDWVVPLSPGFGTWRTHALAPAAAGLWRVPRELREKGLAAMQAATVSVNPLTALRLISDFGTRFDGAGVERRGLREGDWLVQNGANSAVGRLVIQLARLRGLRTLNVVRQRHDEYATEPLRQELLALGADVVVTDAELGRLPQVLKEASGGKGAGLMLDCVGGKPAGALAKALSQGAEVVTYGAMSKTPHAVGAGALIFRDLRYRGFWVSRWGERFPQEKKKAMEWLLGLMAEGKLKTAEVEGVEWGSTAVDEAGRAQRLAAAVQKTLSGFRGNKNVFVFEGDE